MGLTTAMYTGLSGLNANQTRIDTIGHNIANVNTHAFKGSRTLFQAQLSRTISAGNGPTATSGGVNPTQVGLGVSVATTQRNFNNGAIETTGINSDLAIEGDGFFIVQDEEASQYYTRDGSFVVNGNNELVTQDGHYVRGFTVDENFNIQPTILGNLTIPLGTLTDAQASESVSFDGDLSAAGLIATAGTVHTSQAFTDPGGTAATAGTTLFDLRNPGSPGTALFATGDVLSVSGLTKGERSLPDATFTVGVDGNTLGDLADWISAAVALNTEDGVPGSPGATIVNGALVITSNTGTANALGIGAADFVSNGAVSLPLQFSQTQTASGESKHTSFLVYDSLGTPITVNATFALEATPDTGPVWRFYLESPQEDGPPVSVGTGTITFDTDGNYVSATGDTVQLDLADTGAATPLSFTLDFSSLHGLSTQSTRVIGEQVDGFPAGTLQSYRIGQDGLIEGAFSNGESRTLGQVAVAVFSNPEGMLAETDNLYSRGPNTGEPTVTVAGQFGSGTILAGALELSNVDLSEQFIGLITTSAGFQASSRVISTSSDMLDQLLLILR